MVIVDTSLWIEFFGKPKREMTSTLDELEQLIEDGVVAIIKPVRAELRSGVTRPSKIAQFDRVVDSLESADPDWNSSDTWDSVVGFSEICRKSRIPLPGLVDRMILSACQLSGAKLWTLDRRLEKLAKVIGLAK